MSKFSWTSYISTFVEEFPEQKGELPWVVTERVRELIKQRFKALGKDFKVTGEHAVHKSAVIESNVVMKGPIIIGPNCFVATGCYLRDGVFLAGGNSLGPGCEIKSSILFPSSNLAHFNFVGDSVIGTGVNFEAGAVIANHFNERSGVEKFGALIGDGCKIGANAVLSPGTILAPGAVVGRLQLVDQAGS